MGRFAACELCDVQILPLCKIYYKNVDICYRTKRFRCRSVQCQRCFVLVYQFCPMPMGAQRIKKLIPHIYPCFQGYTVQVIFRRGAQFFLEKYRHRPHVDVFVGDKNVCKAACARQGWKIRLTGLAVSNCPKISKPEHDKTIIRKGSIRQ